MNVNINSVKVERSYSAVSSDADIYNDDEEFTEDHMNQTQST